VVGWAFAVLRGGDDSERFFVSKSHHRDNVGSQR
jgi:hypothetical protein